MKRIQMKRLIVAGGVCSLVFCASITLCGQMTVWADGSIDNVKVAVPESCTMSGDGMTSHVTDIQNGTYVPNIGTTNIRVVCNDSEGFAIYASGFTNNEIGTEDSNKLLGSPIEIGSIITGTATSAGSTDQSNWAMKLAITQDSGDTTSANAFAIDGGFGVYHAVPNTYTKVAHKNAMTDMDTTTGGAKFTTTYAAYISKTQPAGSYSGQVKFVLVHPSNHAVPDENYGITMQTVDEWGWKVDQGVTTVAIDERDNVEYTVARLADGRLWMTKNLRLNLATANITADNTNHPSAAFLTKVATKPFATNDGAWCSDASECGNNIQYSTINLGNTTSDAYGFTYDDYGGYYNWYTATAGNGEYSTPSYTVISGDICPKGWHLPEMRDPRVSYENEFYDLANATKGSGSYNDSTNVQRFLAEPISMPMPGYVMNSNNQVTVMSQGSYGAYWSNSKESGLGYAKYWMIRPENMHSDNSGAGRIEYGNSVRCIANLQDYPLTVEYGVGVSSLSVDGNALSNGATINLTEGTSHSIAASTSNGYHLAEWVVTGGSVSSISSENTTYVMAHTPATLRAVVEEDVTFEQAYEDAGKSKIGDYYSMQDMTASICGDVTIGQTGSLIDVRDNSVYSVARLVDGKCWMNKNLKLDVHSATINANNTNNPTVAFLSERGTASSSNSWCTTGSAECINKIYYNTSNLEDNNYKDYGVYYNWYTATAGNGTYDMAAPSAIASGDLCPKNWHLASGVSYNGSPSAWTGDYWELAASLAGIGIGNVTDADYGTLTSSTNMARFASAPNNFDFSGIWNGSAANSRGSYGHYWAANSYGNAASEQLMVFNNGGNLPGSNSKYYGLTMRCVADN